MKPPAGNENQMKVRTVTGKSEGVESHRSRLYRSRNGSLGLSRRTHTFILKKKKTPDWKRVFLLRPPAESQKPGVPACLESSVQTQAVGPLTYWNWTWKDLEKLLDFDEDEGVMAQADAQEEGRSSDLKFCRIFFFRRSQSFFKVTL